MFHTPKKNSPTALEILSRKGHVMISGRNGFQGIYDLAVNFQAKDKDDENVSKMLAIIMNK
jgi:uncharacterized protein YcaQ